MFKAYKYLRINLSIVDLSIVDLSIAMKISGHGPALGA